jgi:hypothetical protein
MSCEIIICVSSRSGASWGNLAEIKVYDDMLEGLRIADLDHALSAFLKPLASLTDECWVLYASVEEMVDHYERIDQHRNEALRQHADLTPTT